MQRFKVCYNWLLLDSYLVIVVGLFIAFMKTAPFFMFDKFLNPYFWNAGIVNDSGTILFQKFMYSLLGACMAVWGVMILFILKNSFSKKEKWARNSILLSLLVWFPIDEFFSIYYGIYFNAIFNIPFLLLIITPVVLTWKDFNRVS